MVHIVSDMWRTEMKSDVISYNFIWVVVMLCLGCLELLALYKLKQHVHKMTGSRYLHLGKIVDFVFILNCVGLPLYFIACFIAKYYTKGSF